MVFAPNLAWRDEPLRAEVAARVGLPVAVENDANAAAWMNDEKSRVKQAKTSPLSYDLLAELNTRPRTSYEGRLLNRNPKIDE